jgi:hypothetical protein
MESGAMPRRASPSSRSAGKAVTFATVRRMALQFPGVEEGTSYGTPALRVKGKFLARLKEDGGTLVVRIDQDEREVWMKANPETFFITDHYRGWPAMLVRLSSVDRGALRKLLEIAWRWSAPKRLIAERDGRAR